MKKLATYKILRNGDAGMRVRIGTGTAMMFDKEVEIGAKPNEFAFGEPGSLPSVFVSLGVRKVAYQVGQGFVSIPRVVGESLGLEVGTKVDLFMDSGSTGKFVRVRRAG
jgi:hypothetical protein